MLQPRKATRMTYTQDLVDPIPDQLPRNATRMQGVMDIDISFNEKSESFHAVYSWEEAKRLSHL
jgi:hypothetical protein